VPPYFFWCRACKLEVKQHSHDVLRPRVESSVLTDVLCRSVWAQSIVCLYCGKYCFSLGFKCINVVLVFCMEFVGQTTHPWTLFKASSQVVSLDGSLRCAVLVENCFSQRVVFCGSAGKCCAFSTHDSRSHLLFPGRLSHEELESLSRACALCYLTSRRFCVCVVRHMQT
jgi:hypothetical protein